jgi:hypothetical protein
VGRVKGASTSDGDRDRHTPSGALTDKRRRYIPPMDPEKTPSEREDEREARRSGEVHLRIPGLRQLFDPMDPSPVTGKDLHPRVEEYIVSWGREIPGKLDLALVIHVDDPVADADARAAASGTHAFFEERARVNQRALRRLFRVGRISLLIALVVLVLAIVAGELLQAAESPVIRAVGGTLEIGGWVAMWRPLETFLYDWWPLRADIRLLRRLARMDVRVVCDREL